MLDDVIEDFLSGISFGHDVEDYIRTQGSGGRDRTPIIPGGDKAYTDQYLAGFALHGHDDGGDSVGDSGNDVLVDPAFHGSLVWPAQFHARRRDVELASDDPKINRAAERIGSCFTKEWFEKFLSRLKLEEEAWEGDKDEGTPGLWTANFSLLTYVFQLMELGKTAVKLEDVGDLVKTALADDTRIGHHIAAATLLLGLMWSPRSRAFRSRVLKTAEPLLIDILEHKMSLASGTWVAFLRRLTQNRDPRRYPGLVRYVSSIQMDVSDSAPNNNAKLDTLKALLTYVGWRFRYEEDVVSMLLQVKDDILNVGVAAALGTTLASVYPPRFHDSWASVRALIVANREASPLGIRPYGAGPGIRIRNAVTRIFKRVSALRQQKPIPHREYHSAATVALAFVFGIFETNASGVLVHMLCPIVEELFLMLDAHLSEKTELKDLATGALEKLCRLPFCGDEAAALWQAILPKAQAGELTHRIAAMGMIRELYLRRLFTSTLEEQETALRVVSDRIQDTHSKIQTRAAETLTYLLSRSRLSVTEPIIKELVQNSINALKTLVNTRKTSGKDSSVRLAAVRRLSAAVSAFPHVIEAPEWMVKAMETLVHETKIAITISTKIAITALNDFKDAKRTQWDMVKEVSQQCFHQDFSRIETANHAAAFTETTSDRYAAHDRAGALWLEAPENNDRREDY